MATTAGSFRNRCVLCLRLGALSGPLVRSAGLLGVALGILGLVSGCAGNPALDPTPTSEVLLQEARAKMEKEKYYQARETLKAVVNNPTTDPPIMAEAQLLLADAYFRQKGFLNLAEAQSRYQTFLTFHPRHESADYAQFQLAMCYFQQVLEPDRDQDQTRQAIEEFRKVETLYPGSPYVEPARQKIIECRDRIAEQNFLVGRFYLRRGAPKAAIQRFLGVLEEFPAYPGREKVYFFLAKAYKRTGEEEKVREYLDLLLRDFPDGKYAKEAIRARQKSEAGVFSAGPPRTPVPRLARFPRTVPRMTGRKAVVDVFHVVA